MGFRYSGADPENWSLLGFGAEEINGFAFTALTRRLALIGVDSPPPRPEGSNPWYGEPPCTSGQRDGTLARPQSQTQRLRR
jgi:hypothetical protein